MAKRHTPIQFGGGISLGVTLLLLLFVVPLPAPVRFLIAAGLVLAGLAAVCKPLLRRFGRKAAVVLAGLAVFLFGFAIYNYWLDAPNRQTLAQINQLQGCYATTNGKLLTGKVVHLYISSKASDETVSRFADIDGLDELRNLIIVGPQISDATAKKLAQLKSLRNLSFRETEVSEAAIENLIRELPNCNIEVR